MPKSLKAQTVLKSLIMLSALFLAALIFAHQGDFNSLDLGRHLKNGELVWKNPDLLFKNFYSFTEPNFIFINHHWFSGVIYYLLFLLGGFNLLSLLNILLALGAVFISFLAAKKRANFSLAAILALPVIFILSERTDIRPEMFSALFLILEFYLINKFRRQSPDPRLRGDDREYKYLYFLIPLHLLWVNLHIYFFLGLFILSLALAEQIIIHKNFAKIKNFFYLVLACFAVSLANPNFIANLLYPLNILKKYGYEIVENKSPFFLEHLTINPNILLFKILLFLLISSFVFKFFKTKKIDYFDLILAGFFSFLGYFAIRNLPIVALISWPIMAGNFNKISFNYKQKNLILIIILTIYLSLISFLIYDYKHEQNYLKTKIGPGLSKNSLASLNFYKNNNLAGAIFNNYDLGSALIWGLAPKEKVFVDNRPEAYSVDFFQNIYKPMQQDEQKWQELSEKYKINLIYFSHTDGTPWAQEFLSKRLKDPNWPLIYLDEYNLIFAKNIPENQALIQKYLITPEKFEKQFNNLAENTGLIKTEKSLADLAALYGRIDLALKIYEDLLAKYPNNGLILAKMGGILAGSKNISEVIKALSYYEKALENGLKLPAIYNQMGLISWQLQDHQKARDYWSRALKLDSKNAHAIYYLKQADDLGV